MKHAVYIEVGQKGAFGGSIDWPGWCRMGKDEGSALQALVEYGSRYGRVLQHTALGFKAPSSLADLEVTERLKGTTTTDFGAPDRPPASDARGLDQSELQRYEALLRACWQSFDAACRASQGRTLRTGPRGGGRDLKKMIAHVLDADEAYLSRLGWAIKRTKGPGPEARLGEVRRVLLEGLRAAAKGEIPAEGPRGGRRWSSRYFVRRVAWHVLDHAWEIEDRLV